MSYGRNGDAERARTPANGRPAAADRHPL